MNGRQSRFVEEVKGASYELVRCEQKIEVLGAQWDDEFKSGGDNEIENVDIANEGLSVSDLEKIKTVADRLSAFMNNEAVTSGQHGTFLKRLMGHY